MRSMCSRAQVEDKFADPAAVAARKTSPIVDEACEVLVVGAGFGGILCSVRLREQLGDALPPGAGGLRIIEKGGDFGGTWVSRGGLASTPQSIDH